VDAEGNRTLKVADFGLSRKIAVPARRMTKEVSTLWYRAPEVLLDNLCYSQAMDMWSVGTIIFEMLYGEIMFKGDSEIDQIIKIFSYKGTPTRKTLKSYDKCPVLLKIGNVLPKFSSKNPKDSDSIFTTEESNINDDLLLLIESLTNLEPTKRPSARQAFEKLSKMELRSVRDQV